MSNPGNTGQRYKLSKLVGVEIVGETIVHRLSCGHEYASTGGYCSVGERYGLLKRHIGKKQRCSQCQPKKA